MRFAPQPLLWSAALALFFHGFIVFLWPTLSTKSINLSKDPVLRVQLYRDTTEPEEGPSEVEKEEHDTLPRVDSTMTKKESSKELSGSNDKEDESTPTLITSLSSLQNWASRETKERSEIENKVNLSALRKGSYTEQWLDPDRADTRDSDKDTKISVGGGTIWVTKVKGKLVCQFVDLDGKVSGFNCGGTERNQFVNADGSVKNSGRVDW